MTSQLLRHFIYKALNQLVKLRHYADYLQQNIFQSRVTHA